VSTDDGFSEEEAAWQVLEGKGPAREAVELLGLLPYELEPVEPSPIVRHRLLRAVAEEDSGKKGTTSRPLPMALTAIAASMLVILGLLVLRLNGEQRALELERQRLEQALSRSSSRESETLARLQAVNRQLGLVAAPATSVCPLRPPARDGTPRKPGTWGALYVAADLEHWYIRLYEMESFTEPREYHVWFLVEGRPVRAGALEARSAPYLELASEGFPESMKGVVVTLESNGAGPQPQGPVVLSGDEMIRVF
jgi:hypothetical protein